MGRRFSFFGRATCAVLCLALLSACATAPHWIEPKPFASDRLQGMSCTALLAHQVEVERELHSLYPKQSAKHGNDVAVSILASVYFYLILPLFLFLLVGDGEVADQIAVLKGESLAIRHAAATCEA